MDAELMNNKTTVFTGTRAGMRRRNEPIVTGGLPDWL